MNFAYWFLETIIQDFNKNLIPENIIDIFITEENTPDCPKCSSPMILRTNSKTGSQFYGCSKFPKCTGTKGYSAQQKPTQTQQTPAQPAQPSIPAPRPVARSSWVKAKVVNNQHPEFKNLQIGQEIALQKQADNSWQYITLDNNRNIGQLCDTAIRSGAISSVKDDTGKPVTSEDLDDLFPAAPMIVDEAAKKKHVLDMDKLSEEQKAIDMQFERQMKSGQDHIMISARAGTGKTTILKHLAWKYGKPGQHWLYLVFNTKNKVEAKGKFPPWVETATTNGFLGKVIKMPANGKFNTKRSAELNSKLGADYKDEAPIDKTELLVNGDKFHLLLTKLKFPMNAEKAADRGGDYVGFDDKGKQILAGFIERAILNFQKQVITFVGLAKSFAVDPRKADLDSQLKKIYDSYGPLPSDPTAGEIDDDLSDIKSSINTFKNPSYRQDFIDAINTAFGFNFMAKNWKDELFEATKTLLKDTLPNGTNEKAYLCEKDNNVWIGNNPKCSHCGSQVSKSFDLGEYRDFSDDLWYSAIYSEEMNFPKYDFILADEVQDFNECQKIMLKRLHDKGAKIVAVGDSFQSIYRWRGADSNAFDNLGKQLSALSGNKDVIKNLSSNYRSRKAVIDYSNQNTIVKDLKQGKYVGDPDEGIVTEGKIKYDDVFTQLKTELDSGGLKKQTAFLARTNEPLAHAAMKLLANGIPFVVIGKDVGGSLKKYVKKISNQFVKGHSKLRSSDDITTLGNKSVDYIAEENNRYRRIAAKQAYLKSLNELSQALNACIGQFYNTKPPKTDIESFEKWLKSRLGGLDWDAGDEKQSEKEYDEYQKKIEDKNTVILTTVHKSKGLEFPRVMILRIDQFPHPKAKRPESLREEEHGRYVAYTRAQDELHIVDLKGQPGVN
jgi:ssDNA-binding Zn-finger/Zn-ribbon topoisomerase 1